MKLIFKKSLSLILLLGLMFVTMSFTRVDTKKVNAVGDNTWTRVTSVDTLLAGGTFIIGYEATENSGIIIPMGNTGSATTSTAGYIYSGNPVISGGTGTLDMNTYTEDGADFIVNIKESEVSSGKVTIKIGDNFIGNSDTSDEKNKCKLFAADSAGNGTSFTATIGDNDVITLKNGNTNYHTFQYNNNKDQARFCCYKGTQKNLVIYKLEDDSLEDDSFIGSFQRLKTLSSLKVSYNYNINPLDYVYELVEDHSSLQVGDKIVIASNDNGVTAGSITSNYMTNVVTVFSSDKKTITNLGAGTIELTLGGSEGAWTLAADSYGLLGATDVKKVCFNGGTTTWSISIEDGIATIQNSTSSYGRFLYNVTNTRFNTYTSVTSASMLLPQIYKMVNTIDYSIPPYSISTTVKNDKTVNDLAIRFGTKDISEELFEGLGENAEFGVFYAKKDVLGASIREILDSNSIDDKIAGEYLFKQEITPVLNDNGDYQFAVVINGIPSTKLDEIFVATCYVYVDEVYYIMEETQYSINSIAKDYVNNHAKEKQVKDYLGMLSWLSAYVEE